MWNLCDRRARFLLLCLVGTLLARPVHGQPAAAPSAAAANAPLPEPIKENPAWFLKGGLITGRFVGAKAQLDWPTWMQALVGGREGVTAEALGRADLYKIPDAFLPQAIRMLETNRIFQPRLLRQATAIGYTARAAEWQEAKSSYQAAYLKAAGLPMDDPLTTSRLITQLAYRNEFELLREALQGARLPARTLASFLRLLELREGKRKASAAWVLDRRLPAPERLHVLTALKNPGAPGRLLASFRGTDFLDLAVFHAVSKDWVPLGDPRVDEALRQRRKPEEKGLWFLNRPEERVSDLRWMRAMAGLRAGRKGVALAHAKAILAQYPESYYAGHAGYLAAGLEPAFQLPARPSLRVPGDITLFNAPRIQARLEPPRAAWSEPYQALAARNRFDLILAQADPVKEEADFFRAAFLAGQQDLIARYQALEWRSSIDTAPYLFPVRLEPLVARLIAEEGLTGLVDAPFVLAMIKNESIFQPEARSGADAFGIMQLLKPTFVHMAGRGADILDPETNIRAGLRYYRTVIRTAQLEPLPATVRMLYVLAGYHAGEGRARRWRLESEALLGGRTTPAEMMLRVDAVPISSTRNYILRVLGDRECYLALLGRARE